MKGLLPIFLIVTIDVLGLTIVIPLLPFYAEHFGASPFVVGLVLASYSLCQLLSGPILGRLSDRLGRRPILIVSQMGSIVGFMILAFANSLPAIFLARFIDGFTAGNISIAQAYISDISVPEERARSFGIIGVAFGIGFLLGPAISGYLAAYDYRYPIFAAALLSLVSVVATYYLLPNHQKPTDTTALPVAGWDVFQPSEYARYFTDPKYRNLMYQFLMFALTFSLFMGGFALFSERRFTSFHGRPYGAKEVGYAFAYAGFIGLIMQGWVVGHAVKRWGEPRVVLWGFLASSVGYTVLANAHSVVFLLVALTLLSLGHAVLRPSLTSLITQQANAQSYGVVLGVTQSLNSFAQIVCPLYAGLLIDHALLAGWAYSIVFLAFIGGALAKIRLK